MLAIREMLDLEELEYLRLGMHEKGLLIRVDPKSAAKIDGLVKMGLIKAEKIRTHKSRWRHIFTDVAGEAVLYAKDTPTETKKEFNYRSTLPLKEAIQKAMRKMQVGSVKSLAERMQVPQKQLYDVCNGHYRLSSQLKKTIEQYAGCNIE